eukprot:CAMPEP_0181335822 /NCGR_PEP_ID=MMETSP1101-20121128/27053_1 /TAXON_ID=46948 /ORGANISM="Rhodomonas abbreviata, Strain Caron Lab Isolate" /LENGTH=339 /DNA_ID=CAMNT_0023446001 /DNA_START=497 /DNA_END=1516 /DNA_ORIENTATION=+
MFKADMSGALFVSSVVPDGPAHKCGTVKEGDVLFEVDGVNVYRCPASQCASSLMGPRGSKVRICFLRRGTPFEVSMIRDFVQAGSTPNDSMTTKRNEDLDRSRSFATDGQRTTDISTAESLSAGRRTSHGSSLMHFEGGPGTESPPHRWDGFWENRGGWSPNHPGNSGNYSPEGAEAAIERGKAMAMARLRSSSSQGGPVAAEELDKIKQKLDRQERWAETLGPPSPLIEPVEGELSPRGRRRSPRMSPRMSPRTACSSTAPMSAMARGGDASREGSTYAHSEAGSVKEKALADPNLESIRKKLDRQDKWIEKIFQHDKSKRSANASTTSSVHSVNGSI